MLEEDNRVVQLMRFNEEIVGVLRGAREDDDQSGVVDEPRLDYVSVERPTTGLPPQWYAHCDGDFRAPAPTKLGRVVDQRVHRQRREATELYLSYRAQPAERCSGC